MALIAGWHLPLRIARQIHYADIVIILAALTVFNLVFNNTNGSVLIMMVMHAVNNAVSASSSPQCLLLTQFACHGY